MKIHIRKASRHRRQLGLTYWPALPRWEDLDDVWVSAVDLSFWWFAVEFAWNERTFRQVQDAEARPEAQGWFADLLGAFNGDNR
jgi:hypothetical protein